jgi:tetratricopeptide (TPR) repeat protein
MSSMSRKSIITRTLASIAICLLLALPVAAQDTGAAGGGNTQQQPSLTVASEFLERAAQAYGAQDFDQALLDISLFVYLNPTSSQGYYVRSLVLAARQETDDALADLDRAITLTNDDLFGVEYRATLLTARAEILQATGDLDGALADYDTSLAVAPTLDAYRGRAVYYARQGNFDAALADVDAAIALVEQADTAGLLLFRASLNVSQGDDEAAANDYFRYAQVIASDFQPLEGFPIGEVAELEMATGRVYALAFEVQAGQTVSAGAGVGDGNAVDPLIILVDPDGNALIANDDVAADDFSAVISGFPITADGVYSLIVTHAAGGDTGTIPVIIAVE